MKTLKFSAPLPEMILSGEKTTTWRINDDKDIQKGDIISLRLKKEAIIVPPPMQSFKLAPMGAKPQVIKPAESENIEFAKAEVISVNATTFGSLSMSDLEGHEKFKSYKEMMDTYGKYYNMKIADNTRLKVIKFKLI